MSQQSSSMNVLPDDPVLKEAIRDAQGMQLLEEQQEKKKGSKFHDTDCDTYVYKYVVHTANIILLYEVKLSYIVLNCSAILNEYTIMKWYITVVYLPYRKG